MVKVYIRITNDKKCTISYRVNKILHCFEALDDYLVKHFKFETKDRRQKWIYQPYRCISSLQERLLNLFSFTVFVTRTFSSLHLHPGKNSRVSRVKVNRKRFFVYVLLYLVQLRTWFTN